MTVNLNEDGKRAWNVNYDYFNYKVNRFLVNITIKFIFINVALFYSKGYIPYPLFNDFYSVCP